MAARSFVRSFGTRLSSLPLLPLFLGVLALIIGVCRISLHLPGNRSLKGKRQIIKRICERIRHRFPISIAEVGDLEAHQRAQIGLALVSNDQRLTQIRLDHILQAIEQMALAVVLERRFEILSFGQDFGQDLVLFPFSSEPSPSAGLPSDASETPDDPDWDLEAEEAALAALPDDPDDIPEPWRDDPSFLDQKRRR